MIIVYSVSTYCVDIQELEVQKLTPKFVVFKDGYREARKGPVKQYFETRKEALAFLIYREEKKIKDAEYIIKRAKEDLDKIQGLFIASEC